MAVITRWSYKRGGRKAGFHCIVEPFLGSIVITVEAFWTETLSDTLTVHDQLSAALTKSFLTRPV